MRLQPFDLSDVIAQAVHEADLERRIHKANELRARGFAQGFTAALEDGNAQDWLEHYQEREA